MKLEVITHKVKLNLRVGKDEDKHDFLVTSLGGTETVYLVSLALLKESSYRLAERRMRLASTEQSNSEEIEVDIHKIAAT